MFDKRVGWSFFILLLLSFIYLLRPFINGLGCNFSFVAESEHIKQIGKCRAGILTTYYEVSGVGTSSYNRYFYGVDKDFIYAFRVNKERVDKKDNNDGDNGSSSTYEDHHHAINFYDGDRFYIFKYNCNGSGKCFVMSDDHIENIYELSVNGSVGLF